MGQIIFLIFSSFIALTSCKKETSTLINQPKHLIDTTIILTDTFDYNFGSFGDEEGISIISYPKNSKSCELLNKPSEERILRYIPQDNFLGIDSMMVKTMKGSDGASPSTDIDTILVIIKVVKDDFHKNLIGKWNWTRSCGGFTGGCSYPNETNSKQIEFDYSMRYIERLNNSIIADSQYQLLNSFTNGQSTIYKVRFLNKYDRNLWFLNDKLNIQKGDLVEEYDRSK